MTPMDRVKWARKIAEWRIEGREWKDIAKDVGLTQRNCQKLHQQYMESGDPDSTHDPMAPIHRHLQILEAVMAEAANTYAAAPDGSSVQVGALRLMKDASAEVIDYMRLAGMLPRHLGALALEQEMQQMMREFIEHLRRYNVDDKLLAELHDLAERRRRPAVIEGGGAASAA